MSTMKQLLFFLFLSLSTMIFAQDGKVTLTKAASYDQLNKQVNKFSDEGLPKSAIAILDILMEKAEEDKNFAEYVNA